MDIGKIKTYIGFSIKSGNIIFGYDNLIVARKKPELVILCHTQNEKVSNKVKSYCENNSIRIILLKDISLGELIGRNCKVVGLLDGNLAEAIIKEME